MRLLVDLVVVVSMGFSEYAVPRLRQPADGPARPGVSPLVALAVVTVLLYLNQVLVTVYVIRVHGGDAGYIADRLLPGWFDVATGWTSMQWLAAHWPAPQLLSVCVLRVPSLLELPFGMLGYLVVLRWIDARLYRTVALSALLPAAAVSYTLAFDLIEKAMPNQFTVQDIVLRAVTAVLTTLGIRWLARRDGGLCRVRASILEIGVLIASLAALGVLVMVVYDTALLYDLDRLARRWPLGLATIVVLVLLRLAAARLSTRPEPATGQLLTLGVSVLRWFLVLFFVPALAVRYSIAFGTPWLVYVAIALLAGTAIVLVLRGRPLPSRRLVLAVGGVFLAGFAGAVVASLLTPPTYAEGRLLVEVAVFLAVAVLAARVVDWISARNSYGCD